MKEDYIVNCCRTPIGSYGGALKDTPAVELGAITVREALRRANVSPEWVDEVIFGGVLTAGLGQNVARQVGIRAGIPYSVPAFTLNMVCGSGMKAVMEAARAIRAEDAELIVCGGAESMSRAAYASSQTRFGARMGDVTLIDTMIRDGLWDAYNNYHMGTTAENVCDLWGITRQELDAFAAASQQKAVAAMESGRFADEIVPVPVKRKRETVDFAVDEYPKPGTTAESVAKLRGAFPVGPEDLSETVVHTFEPSPAAIHAEDCGKRVQRVTAANASGLNDGAAALIVSAILTTLYLMSVVVRFYFPLKDGAPLKDGYHEADGRMTGPLLFLSALIVVLSVASASLLNWIGGMV